mmetsp:Transcript_54372/g.168347  ORF Transcript_54372/g.168347 Transcript_54372/m.168347 type:complete len:530 (+) Transcript_54372:406-1995(+)
MRGRQRRRAGSVAYEVRPLHVEDKAEAVGDDGLHVGAALRLRALGHAVPVILVQAHGAAAVVGVAVGDLLRDAHLEEVLGPGLQDHALHGVHDPCLAQDDLEELVVEELDALHHGLVLRGALPGHEGVLIRVVVVREVPAGVGDLDAGVAAAVEAGPVGVRLVEAGHEARRHVRHLDLLAHGPRRALALEEEGRVALPVEEVQARGLLQEGRGQGERLLVALALVVEDCRPENEDGVRLGFQLQGLLLARQRVRRALARGLEDDVGRLRAHEVHDLQELAPPDAEELAQGGVVGVLRRVLGLLVVREREAHERRRALVDLLPEHVRAVGLDQARQPRDEGVAPLQQLVLRRVDVRGVQPGDLPAVVGAQVTLFHLLGEALELAGLRQLPHGLHGRRHLLLALAEPEHAEALLEEAGGDLVGQGQLVELRAHQQVEAARGPALPRALQVLRHLHVLRLRVHLLAANQRHAEALGAGKGRDLAEHAVEVRRVILRLGQRVQLHQRAHAQPVDREVAQSHPELGCPQLPLRS